MKCIFCNHEESKVIDSREAEEAEVIRRRRECLKCEERFTTYERIENVRLAVIKRDGKREQFDREKLKFGILRSSEKTTVSAEDVGNIVDEVERELISGDSVEVEAKKIGQMVAARLKKIDKIAYIRFSSVFKRFVDVEDFEKELQRLIK